MDLGALSTDIELLGLLLDSKFFYTKHLHTANNNTTLSQKTRITLYKLLI